MSKIYKISADYKPEQDNVMPDKLHRLKKDELEKYKPKQIKSENQSTFSKIDIQNTLENESFIIYTINKKFTLPKKLESENIMCTLYDLKNVDLHIPSC